MCHNRRMRYEEIKERKNQDFKRLTGVEHKTFKHMVSVLEIEIRNFGRPPKLGRAAQLLMALMYWREYRTQFHIAQAYGISKSVVCRTIRKIEDALMNSGKFRLPGKKALHPSDTVIEIVVVDVTEQPIERPKKATATLQWKEETTHAKGTSNSQSTYDANHCNRFWQWQ